ncbi:hypothetical protein ACROYT_G013495 [Oculina patagonica]
MAGIKSYSLRQTTLNVCSKSPWLNLYHIPMRRDDNQSGCHCWEVSKTVKCTPASIDEWSGRKILAVV